MRIPARVFSPAIGAASAALFFALLVGGCAGTPRLTKPIERKPIDRKVVEYPAGFELTVVLKNLTAPTSVVWDHEGSMIVAEGGFNGDDPQILGFHRDGTKFMIYPRGRNVPLLLAGFRIYGPVGGMVAADGRLYVAHRDEDGFGVITCFGYDGSHRTVVAGLPAQGDYGITDLVMHPTNGRLYFGVGTATNSGVVGVDNFATGWVRKHPKFHDIPWVDLFLLGYRFSTPNPLAGLFGGDDIAITGPFQAFGNSILAMVRAVRGDKPGGAIYSVDAAGGGWKVEAWGVHNPRGLGFHPEYQRLFMTDTGMELRGTRPVWGDPDAFYRVVPETWYGWPDYSRDLDLISEERFQPPSWMLIKSGYQTLSPILDHRQSGLIRPSKDVLLWGVFPPHSGAAKFTFVPATGAFARDYRGSALIALSGDRAPFATSGLKPQVLGYRVVRVDLDPDKRNAVTDFVRNTDNQPASRTGQEQALERPVDVKFGPDGDLYILDFGQMEMKGGRERIKSGSGRLLRLSPSATALPQQP